MRRYQIRMLCLASCGWCLAILCPPAWAQGQPRSAPFKLAPLTLAPLRLAQVPLNPETRTTPPPPTPVTDQQPPVNAIDPMVRGPVHEGFAEMVGLTPQPTAPVAGQPPQPINELPADVRPDNPDAEWLPGYWGWDIDSKSFIWVSGTWRIPPPGTRWVPGYWTMTAAGAQRVPGFWVSSDTEQVNYLPAPPPYENEGVDPASPPSPDVFWVPGYYAFVNGNYNFEPGYWARMVPGWMWIAAHYAWTPDGYVFVDGRWDYPLDQRGMLFSPVAFQSPLYQQAGFSYSPDYLVDLGMLAENLFVNPAAQDYYFGDYYGNQYQQAGIYPWFSVGTGAYLYDPIFAYQGWFDARRNPGWRNALRQRYANLVRNPSARPPRTWRDEQRLARGGGRPGQPYRPLVMPINQALKDKRFDGHLVRLNNAQRQEARQNVDVRRRLALTRSQLEHPPAAERPVARPEALRAQRTLRLPPTRTIATRPGPNGRDEARPGPQVNPRTERRVEPRAEPRAEPRPQPRPQVPPGIQERPYAPGPARGRTEPIEPRGNPALRVNPEPRTNVQQRGNPEQRINPPPRASLPRRPERVMSPPRAAAARRPAPARPEKRP